MDVRDIGILVGVVTGPASLLVAVLNYRRDRSRVVLRASSDMDLFDGPKGMHSEGPYLVLTVTNRGRRSVTIQHVGWRQRKAKTYSFNAGSLNPRTLAEGQSTTYLVAQGEVDFGDIAYFVAYDSLGRQHRLSPKRMLADRRRQGAGHR